MFMTIDRDRYLTLAEAAEQFKYTYNHLWRLVKEGAIKVMEIAPRSYLIDKVDLERYQREKPQRRPAKRGTDRSVIKGRKATKPKPTTPGAVLRRAAEQAADDSDDDSDVHYEDAMPEA